MMPRGIANNRQTIDKENTPKIDKIDKLNDGDKAIGRKKNIIFKKKVS